jgi:hypothetical protein
MKCVLRAATVMTYFTYQSIQSTAKLVLHPLKTQLYIIITQATLISTLIMILLEMTLLVQR